MMISDRPKKVLLVVAGVTSVALGTIGIVVPLLPTTPFLLLAAACFVRSSDRLYQWLINHRLFGSYIRNYREHRAVTWQTKVFTLLLLWAAIGYSGLAIVNSWIVRVLLLVIAVAVTVHVLSLNTLSKGRGIAGSDALSEKESQ
jgi:uncharacterized membrane protein YbaN (DUF454 family)